MSRHEEHLWKFSPQKNKYEKSYRVGIYVYICDMCLSAPCEFENMTHVCFNLCQRY